MTIGEPEEGAQAFERMGADGDEILARQRLIDPLLGGSRVLELGALALAGPRAPRSLQDRGAASVVSVDRGVELVRQVADEGAGPGLRYLAAEDVAWDRLGEEAFELVLAHEPSWLLDDPGLQALRKLLAPGGHLLLSLPAEGQGLSGLLRKRARLGRDQDVAPSYEELVTLLKGGFPSVEVVVQRAIVGHALSPLRAADPRLSVEELDDAPDSPAQILFLCGETQSGVLQQRLILSRTSSLVEEVRLAKEAAADQAARASDERHRAEAEARESELDALRALAAAPPPRDDGDSDEALMRRVREAEERAEAAKLHAREAEARLREAERRAEVAEAERAKASLAARRYQAEAEQLRRSSQGLAAAIAGRR